jgi:hypothetical protein
MVRGAEGAIKPGVFPHGATRTCMGFPDPVRIKPLGRAILKSNRRKGAEARET